MTDPATARKVRAWILLCRSITAAATVSSATAAVVSFATGHLFHGALFVGLLLMQRPLYRAMTYGL